MRADPRFKDLPLNFWATVRSVSQSFGYSVRKKKSQPDAVSHGLVSVPSAEQIVCALEKTGLGTAFLGVELNGSTWLGLLLDYFQYRANILNNYVRLQLMDVVEAREMYEETLARVGQKAQLPENKQKGEKAVKAYLTGIVNLTIEENRQGMGIDYSPGRLTAIVRDKIPLRTMSRRLDGAMPHAINPVAVWEIKEYYFTTTFGSRIADGVYETMLDGMEFRELRENENVRVLHYFITDAYYTWWVKGRSYLCRLVELVNTGLVDEILFGREVPERLPILVRSWVDLAKARGDAGVIEMVPPSERKSRKKKTKP